VKPKPPRGPCRACAGTGIQSARLVRKGGQRVTVVQTCRKCGHTPDSAAVAFDAMRQYAKVEIQT
jgi:hypothetical protein